MLINSEKEFKDIVGSAQANFSWETLKPYVRQAELAYIVPAIGEGLYNLLSEIKSPNSDERKLIERLRISSGQYAFAMALAQMTMAIGDIGAAQNVQAGMAALPKWTYVEAKKSAINVAEKALEDALVFIEANNDVFEDYFSDTNSIITGATDFSYHYPAARNSRRFFLEIKNYLSQVEQNDFKTAIGDELYEELVISSDRNNYPQALNYAKYYLANKAISKSIPFLNINADFRVVSDGDGLQNETELSFARRSEIKIAADNEAESYLNKLIAYCNSVASETVLPTYFNSSTYNTSQSNKPYEHYINEKGKPWVMM
jgi:hypothetical protein